MEPQRLAITRVGEFEPLTVGGQPVQVAWAQLHRFLAQALSPAHAALLAEPRENPAGGTMEWYGPAGEIRLPDEADRRRREALVGDIAGLAKDLGRAKDEARHRLGELLVRALSLPDAGLVRQVGDQPVLIAWGHAARRSTAADRRKRWIALGWVLLLGAVATFWLARTLGLPLPGCRIDPAEPAAMATLDVERAREIVLRQSLTDTRRQIAAKRAQCAPPAPLLPAAPKAPASSLPSEVKPSMPAAPKKPVETVPLAAPEPTR